MDFGDLISPREIEDNLGIDNGIGSMFWGDIIMRDHIDKYGVWAKTVKILRANVFDMDLQIPDLPFRVANASPILSHFLHTLKHLLK